MNASRTDAAPASPHPHREWILTIEGLNKAFDGFQVIRVIKETGAAGAMVTDAEILDAVRLLARTEGIFTEAAGGTTLAATRALVKRGVIKPGESVVVCITGNGFKTADVMFDRVEKPTQIGRSLADFERVLGAQIEGAATVTARV